MNRKQIMNYQTNHPIVNVIKLNVDGLNTLTMTKLVRLLFKKKKKKIPMCSL